MEWTDIKTTVPAVWAETAEAIATGISGGGIYIEDYRDLEAQVEAIAHVDLIEQELLDKSRDEVAVHLYIAPDENFAEIGELMRDRLERAEVPYRMEYTGVRQEDWETGWKAYYHAMDIGTRLAVVPSWEAYETDRTVITLDPGMAFGTGTHETTALCLETLDGLVKGGERVLDIGTGSGILAIAALKLISLSGRTGALRRRRGAGPRLCGNAGRRAQPAWAGARARQRSRMSCSAARGADPPGGNHRIRLLSGAFPQRKQEQSRRSAPAPYKIGYGDAAFSPQRPVCSAGRHTHPKQASALCFSA